MSEEKENAIEFNSEPDRNEERHQQRLRLELAMSENNLSAEQLANKILKSPHTVRGWLNEKDPIALTNHPKIAKALGRHEHFLSGAPPENFSPITLAFSLQLLSIFEELDESGRFRWIAEGARLITGIYSDEEDDDAK